MDINKILCDENSRLNFLKGLVRIAKCDRGFDDEESQFLVNASNFLNLSDISKLEIEKCCLSNDKISINFDTNEQKMFFFIQSIQLCWIDHEYSDEEKKEIRLISKELNISENSIIEVEKWVHEGMEWNKKSNNLLALC